MGFLKKTADTATAAISSGDAARIDQAAKDFVYALMEGGGTVAQNMAALADEAEAEKKTK
ncbi:hypothetical protein OG814_33265 [Streptomyces zaomyceticus]|uniref:Antitoxin n=1 Tax=Streptomyces zaomyceticus TaxID=68286 RepID=A0ABZ1LH50_9ACTN